MKEQTNGKLHKIRLFWRIVTTLACALMLIFIFSNSLQPAEESSSQSSAVVDTVQKVVATIAPESPIATATGEAYDKLHADVRTLAHYLEFALLGGLYIWCWFSYTDEKGLLIVPTTGIIITPMVDELLQTLSSGRAAEWLDVAIDILGGASGGFFVLCTLTVGIAVYRKNKEKKGIKGGASAQSVLNKG